MTSCRLAMWNLGELGEPRIFHQARFASSQASLRFFDGHFVDAGFPTLHQA
jgi:hypothetical protein